jgi:hypothetical protein
MNSNEMSVAQHYNHVIFAYKSARLPQRSPIELLCTLSNISRIDRKILIISQESDS